MVVTETPMEIDSSQEEGTSLRSLPGAYDLISNPWDLKDFQKLSQRMIAKGSASFLGG